jgi:hypothetical protein
MGETKSTVELEAKTGDYNRGIAQAEASQARWAAGVKATQGELDNMTAAAQRAAAAAASLANETAKASAAAAAAARPKGAGQDDAKQRADALAHQAKLLAASGAQQAKIDELVQQELRLRAEIAATEGKTQQARQLSQRAELEAAKASARARAEADRAKTEAAKTAVAYLRHEVELTKTAAAAKTTSARAAAEAQAQALGLEMQALQLERAQAQAKSEQLAIDREIAKLAKQHASAVAAAKVSDSDRMRGAGAGSAEAARAAADAAKTAAGGFTMASNSVGGFLDKLGAIGMASIGLQALPDLINRVDAALTGMADKTIAADNATYSLKLNIAGARAAFGGMIDDITLAQMANKAFAMGVATTGAELTLIAAGVKVIAAKLNEDMVTLFDNAITAIGRQSRLILDNLGIIMDQAKAEKIYAESIGITVDALTEEQKAIAFSKAAMIEIGKAAKEAAKSNAEAAKAYKQMKVDLANVAAEAYGFNDSIGKVREGLRGMSDQELQLLAKTKVHGAAIGEFNEAMRARAEAQQQQIKDVTGVIVPLRQLMVSYEEVAAAAKELDTTVGALVETQRESNAMDQAVREAEAKKKAEAETAKIRENASIAQAELMEHEIELQKTMGTKEAELVDWMIIALEYRREAALAAKDEAKAVEIARQIQIIQTKEAVGGFEEKTRAGKSSAQEIRDAEAELARSRLEWAIELAEHDLSHGRSRLAREIDTLRVFEAQRELLELTRSQAEALPESTKLQATQKRLALAEVEHAMEIQRRAELEAMSELEREVVEERLAGINREIERNEALGVSIALLVEQRRRTELELAQRWGTQEEQAQTVHQQEMARLADRRAAEVQAAQERLDEQRRRIELADAEGAAAQALHDRRVELEVSLARAERNHAAEREALHRAEVDRIRQRTAMQQAALGFTSSILGMQDNLNREFLQRAIKNDEKRAKAELRMRGVMAIATAALETVQGVAAIARYDYVGAALHFAAAATGYTLGTMMLMEKIPKQGGGSMGSASAGVSGGNGSFGEGVAEKQKPPPMPLSTDELDDARGTSGKKAGSNSSGNTTVININGPLVTNDASFGLEQIDGRKKAAWG